MAAVLKSILGKFSCDQAVVKLATSGANVQACSSVRQRPSHTNGVAVGSAGSTATLDSRPFSISMRLRVTPSMGTA